MDEKELRNLFEKSQDIFRLETLDRYIVITESRFEAFLRGVPTPPTKNEEWCHVVATARKKDSGEMS